MASSEGQPAPDERVRFLRACDRCRSRKVKCGNENPCKRCVAARAVCSFSGAGGPVRSLLSNDIDAVHEESSAKRRKTTVPTSASKRRKHWLGPDFTAHFFLSRHGYSHHAGTSSGLPLLDVTRRQLAQTSVPLVRGGPSQPDWDQLQNILGSGGAAQDRDALATAEELEYFPGQQSGPEGAGDELIGSIPQTIPVDVMSDLLRIFFQTIHPVWPIIHIPTFFVDMCKWDDHDFAALVVSICMLASRYSQDVRVRSEPANATSAGAHYYELFSKLRHAADANRGRNVVYAVQSLFFASMFHCVDNIPHPVAHGLFAAAYSRILDAGLHRIIPPGVGDSITREMRQRTAWAVFVWDKQISIFCGRTHLCYLWEIDASLPEPFVDADSVTTEAMPADKDCEYAATFKQLILVSAIVEDALRASSHPPFWKDNELLVEIASGARPQLEDNAQLGRVMSLLDKWRRRAPPEMGNARHKDRLGLLRYSVASEQVASIDQMCQLLVAARHLHLETTSSSPDPVKLENNRSALLNNAKELVSLIVQLGSANLLSHCDILIAYRLLFTGRFLLASVLSARADKHVGQAEEGVRILHVTSVALHHFASLFPVALGAAEVLDETIRVCRVSLPSKRQLSGYAWYRPISPNASSASQVSPAQARSTESANHESQPPAEDQPSGLDFGLDTIGPVQGLDLSILDEGGGYGTDFLWLLPNNEAPPPGLNPALADGIGMPVFEQSPEPESIPDTATTT